MLLVLLVAEDSLCHRVALFVANFIVVAVGAAAAIIVVACAALLRPYMKAVSWAFAGRSYLALRCIVVFTCRNLVNERGD